MKRSLRSAASLILRRGNSTESLLNVSIFRFHQQRVYHSRRAWIAAFSFGLVGLGIGIAGSAPLWFDYLKGVPLVMGVEEGSASLLIGQLRFQ